MDAMEQQPAVEAAILDRVLKIEDHVSSMRTLLESHITASHQRQRDLVAAVAAVEQAQRYYGTELIRAYHRLERLYQRLDVQLHQADDLGLELTHPPEPPPN